MIDEEQLEYVKDNDLVLFSYDDDFVRMVKRSDIDHPGIIYCDQRKYSIGNTIRKVAKIIETSQERDLRNKIKYL